MLEVAAAGLVFAAGFLPEDAGFFPDVLLVGFFPDELAELPEAASRSDF